MAKREMKDVIVLLPGIMGSVLERGGKPAWDLSFGALWRAALSGTRSIKSLELESDPIDEEDLGDGISAPRLLPDVHMIPGLWKIDGYGKIAETILSTFDVTAGENYFELPYDWRRDNRVHAKLLARRSADWLKAWRASSGAEDAKLVLVAHSMGGLVSRYFVQCLGGWKDTRVLVTFGTPHRGALNALDYLVNGFKRGVGPLGVDLTSMVRSFTSIYQLLPSYRCCEAAEGVVGLADAPGLPNVDPTRLAAAMAFYREMDEAAAANMDDAEYRASGYRQLPIVGTNQPTSQSAKRGGLGIEALRSIAGKDFSGDGTVPRVSATPRELYGQGLEVYSSTMHGSLQNAPWVLNQLIETLTGFDDDLFSFATAAAPRETELSLDAEDLYLSGEPLRFAVKASEEDTGDLTAVVSAAEDGGEVARITLPNGQDPWRSAKLAPLVEGTYRLRVTGGAGVTPIEDVFTVLDAG